MQCKQGLEVSCMSFPIDDSPLNSVAGWGVAGANARSPTGTATGNQQRRIQAALALGSVLAETMREGQGQASGF